MWSRPAIVTSRDEGISSTSSGAPRAIWSWPPTTMRIGVLIAASRAGLASGWRPSMHAARACRSLFARAQRTGDRAGAIDRPGGADSPQDGATDAIRCIEHDLQSDARTHRVAEVRSGGDVQVVEQAGHIAGHDVDRIRGGVVRLVAASMAPTVETDDPKPGVGERLLPPRADPVELVVRREAVHRDQRHAALGSVDLEMKAHAIAVEIHVPGN